MAMFAQWNWWMPRWLGRILPSVDFDRPLPEVDLTDIVVIPDDLSALPAPSGDLRRVVKSATKLEHLAPDAICVADPLAFTGCGRLARNGGGHGRGHHGRNGNGQHGHNGAAKHPVTLWRGRLSIAIDALQAQAEFNGDGVYQRRIPVETTNVQLPTGDRLRVPTGAEALRLKGYLIMCRNSRRDYAEFADMVDALDPETVAVVLAGLDTYYGRDTDCESLERQWMTSQLVRRLADPDPADLGEAKRVKPAGKADWDNVRQRCLSVAVAMLEEAR